jgi:hypothetical protein
MLYCRKSISNVASQFITKPHKLLLLSLGTLPLIITNEYFSRLSLLPTLRLVLLPMSILMLLVLLLLR